MQKRRKKNKTKQNTEQHQAKQRALVEKNEEIIRKEY